MNVGGLLRAQYAQGHQLLQAVLADIDNEAANDRAGLGTVGSIASIYAHMVFTEDLLVSGFSGGPPIYSSGGWETRIGVATPGIRQTAEWAATVTLDMPAFNDYAKQVWAATEEYAGGLTPDDLDREVPGMGGRSTTLATLIGNVGVIHLNEHMGEIAAIKGMRGLRGLPF